MKKIISTAALTALLSITFSPAAFCSAGRSGIAAPVTAPGDAYEVSFCPPRPPGKKPADYPCTPTPKLEQEACAYGQPGEKCPGEKHGPPLPKFAVTLEAAACPGIVGASKAIQCPNDQRPLPATPSPHLS